MAKGKVNLALVEKVMIYQGLFIILRIPSMESIVWYMFGACFINDFPHNFNSVEILIHCNYLPGNHIIKQINTNHVWFAGVRVQNFLTISSI